MQLLVIDHDLEQISNYNIEDSINLEEVLKLGKKISTDTYQATYKEIEYLIHMDSNNHLKKILYTDNLENKVKISFQKMHYDNASFDLDKMECQRPKDYDIVEG